MPNTLITPSIIAKEALMQLENNLVIANEVHREYKREFVKVGSSVSIRKPVKFITTDGATLSKQDVLEKTATITVDQRKHVGWEFSTQDMTLTIEEYSDRYIKPAMITLAQTMDRSVYSLYSTVWNAVGTPGTNPSTFANIAAAAQRMDEMAVESSDRKIILNPAAAYAIAGNQTSLAAWDGKVKSAYENAQIGMIAGLKTLSSQNVGTHLHGARGGTPLVNGGSQAVTYSAATGANTQTLVTDGWSNSITNVVRAGDVFTIANVFAVNPVPGEGSTGKMVMPYLQQFTVINAANSDGSGNATLTISPAIITSGPYQTVSGAPADNAALTFLGTANTANTTNLAFHKNAFALVTVPLEVPQGAAFASRQSANGLSVRIIKDYDIVNDTEIIRCDILYGRSAIYPDLACRVYGA